MAVMSELVALWNETRQLTITMTTWQSGEELFSLQRMWEQYPRDTASLKAISNILAKSLPCRVKGQGIKMIRALKSDPGQTPESAMQLRHPSCGYCFISILFRIHDGWYHTDSLIWELGSSGSQVCYLDEWLLEVLLLKWMPAFE